MVDDGLEPAMLVGVEKPDSLVLVRWVVVVAETFWVAGFGSGSDVCPRTGVWMSSPRICLVILAEKLLLPPTGAVMLPLVFNRARGSIDFLRRDPPRGRMEVSTAYEDSSSHRSSRSQLFKMRTH